MFSNRVTPQRESVGGSNTKCYCNCSEQLQRANLRIESLEKKLKLLTEENKVLFLSQWDLNYFHLDFKIFDIR